MNAKRRLVAATLVGSMAATAAYAQNNNTGQIVVQGVVPGMWELTVYDITSGYDFDLSTAGSATSDARVGTIHVASNAATTAGLNPNFGSMGGTVVVESANGGRMVNDQSLAGVAGDAQDYRLSLVANAMNPGDGTMVVLYNDTTVFGNGSLNGTYTTDGSILLNMNTTQQLQFIDGDEATYDIVITLGDGDGTIDNRPQSSGVYSDTLTFTIFDDDV